MHPLWQSQAVEIKRKAPTAHTVLEIVRARWGTTAHLVFLVFCLLTNIIVTAMLILGGSAVVSALTGVYCGCSSKELLLLWARALVTDLVAFSLGGKGMIDQ